MTASQVRQAFLDFFKSKEHLIVPSAPIVIKNDPTLLFTNAGMNQFKDYFLGNAVPPNVRIADTQKCLRVSGKHNDLEEVGVDTYHHTMFEMLGNWSFGDYFKADAIKWSWELLTEVYKIDKDDLYVTVFEGDEKEGLPKDEEAWNEWKKYVPESHILLGNKKDNFWEMGDTGPCGPCTEIHFDNRTAEEKAAVPGATLVNNDDPQVIEIWNNVFIQFNRKKDGTLEPLPAKHVDTGMGFERLVRVLQGKRSNYDTDVFSGTIKATENIVSPPAPQKGVLSYNDLDQDSKPAVAYRVISDHIRAISFTIADGQLPSNTGAGYVIRRILRRAVRYYYSYLNYKHPLLHQLVPVLAEQFKEVFPELHMQQDFVAKVIKEEEEAFLRTLEKGLEKMDELMFSTKSHVNRLKRFFDINGIHYSGPAFVGLQSGKLFCDLWSMEQPLYIKFTDSPSDLGDIATEHQLIYLGDRVYSPLEILSKIKRKIAFQNLDFSPLNQISGDGAFELHDTFGFPIDLTKLIASENGVNVDEAGYEAERKKQQERGRAATAIDAGDWTSPLTPLHGERGTDQPAASSSLSLGEGQGEALALSPACPELVSGERAGGEVKFVGYDDLKVTTRVLRYRKVKAKGKEQYQVVIETCPFYAESGGQVGDTGWLQWGDEKYAVTDTKKENDLIILFLDKVPADLSGDVEAIVDAARRTLITYNHTGTHLLHAALHKVLGNHVNQKGSLVSPDVLRFDVSHFAKITDEELREVEIMVNQKIRENILVQTQTMDKDEAMKSGAMALFGEKYGDKVRVVTIEPGFSVELCGGTHVPSTGNIGLFTITGESATAAGVRRIEALTGPAALQYFSERVSQSKQVVDLLKAKDPVKAIEKLIDEKAALEKRIEALEARQLVGIRNELMHQDEIINQVTFIGDVVEVSSPDALKKLSFDLKHHLNDYVAVLCANIGGKAHVCVSLSNTVAAAKNLDAGKIIKETVSPLIQGGGGGQKTLATAGGANVGALREVIEKVKGLL